MYVQQRGTYWVVVESGSNRVLERRRSRGQAEMAARDLERRERRKKVKQRRKAGK